MQKLKTQKGITLIALIITIIVMLILVGVSVTVALNGGLFSTAQKAAGDTETEKAKEQTLASGRIKVGDVWYDSLEAYKSKTPSANQTDTVTPEDPADPEGGNGGSGGTITLPTGWEITEKPAEWTSEKVTAIKEKATGKIVPLPEKYTISEIADEQTVEGGLVVTDGTNEFVWIPVTTDFTEIYSGQTNYSEPKELTGKIYDWEGQEVIFESADSQDTLDGFYGEGYYDYPETAKEKTNVNNTFAYEAHYTEMVDSVNKYDGFYIGRYETTIDGNNIGSQEGKIVLTANAILKDATCSVDIDFDGHNEPCYYRWWGLYAAQRNSNVEGNGSTVQTNMIWGQQWDAMITYFGSKDYSKTPVETLVTFGKQNAGQAKYTYNSEEISDEICNIYDLRGNTYDWIAEASYTSSRASRGRLLQRQYIFSV